MSGHSSTSCGQQHLAAHALEEVAFLPSLVMTTTVTVSLVLYLGAGLESFISAIPFVMVRDCTSGESDCCADPDLPWFHKDLPSSTNDYIELRICGNEETYMSTLLYHSVKCTLSSFGWLAQMC